MKTTLLICTMAAIAFASCKKDDATTTDPPKTLTKSHLYDKYWYTKGNTISHYFQSNGKYGANFGIGTWQWLNNSDTLEIKYSSGGSVEVWHVQWSTEHEFSAHAKGKGSTDLFKDAKW
jgi:glutamine cyclotransferase